MTLRVVRPYPLAIASLAAVLIAATSAAAQSSDIVTIAPEASEASGRIAVNVAAGTLNQQANAAVLSESENALLANIVQQHLIGNTVCTFAAGECASDANVQKATIADGAFTGVSGAIAVNGAAGVENQQANLASFGIANGIDSRVIALTMLSQVRASTEPAGDPDAPAAEKAADISSQAFTDASGLVQINLTAGERNSSANLFALTITGGTD
ncbi:MAG: hypothetical protein H7062_22640 [Candidatus Saccharimonas sp.]|nr:hypothetical protein [Planctomycetaceae bacterium]